MKIKINRNNLWAEAFVRELASLGVKYVSISPGSRNTPLTLAFAANKRIKSFVHVDERSSGFFALGIAKATDTPVAVVCTSGTATVELYPAIVEAYQQRVPLIICTADRPPELLDRGANQTINQINLYKNHIRWFKDMGLPEPSISKLKQLKLGAKTAFIKSLYESKGPVHLNFPFRKPFEPKFTTDEVNEEIVLYAEKVLFTGKDICKERTKDITKEKWFNNIFAQIKKFERGLIIVGPDNYNPRFIKSCQVLSQRLAYPILADGTSQLRFGRHDKSSIITGYDSFFRSNKFSSEHQPDIILQFGRTITSKGLDTFLENSNAKRFMINKYGDWFDPSDKSEAAYACTPYIFCESMVSMLNTNKFRRKQNGWTGSFASAEQTALKLKREIIDQSKELNEARIINEILQYIPDKSLIMLSNSMPVRDFDYFASNNNKDIILYNNRGASGIDGITSTALGIAAVKNKPAVLITGDLAFYYDLTGLLGAKKYNIPLVIVLLNNNGGGIFEVLPISSYGEVFRKYFLAPHNLQFKKFVEAYGGNYRNIINWKDFKQAFKAAFTKKSFSVLEIKTSSTDSLKLRRKYWKAVSDNFAN